MHSFIDDDRTGKTADESWDVFYARLEDVLKTVIKNNATLRPEKTRIGFESTVFYGFEIKNGKSTTAAKNLIPIKTMKTPTCQADVRRVLGIFVQSKNIGFQIAPPEQNHSPTCSEKGASGIEVQKNRNRSSSCGPFCLADRGCIRLT
jgi:hypothetical protein